MCVCVQSFLIAKKQGMVAIRATMLLPLPAPLLPPPPRCRFNYTNAMIKTVKTLVQLTIMYLQIKEPWHSKYQAKVGRRELGRKIDIERSFRTLIHFSLNLQVFCHKHLIKIYKF